MSRNITSARHRADVDGNLALQGLSRAAKAHATAVGRPVAIAAVTSGLALTAVGTANAGEYTTQSTTTAPAVVAAPAVAAPVAPAAVAAPAAAPAASTTHTVVSGDTLGAVSARYGADLSAVLTANGLSVSSIIFPGDTITIPTGAAAAPARTVSVTVAAPQAAPAAFVAPAAAPAAPVAPAAPAVQVQQAAAVAPAAAPAPGVSLQTAKITPVASSGVAGTLVGSAQSQIGTTQDCTAMVEKALRSAGISVGDLAPLQFAQFGSRVGTPAPGDLVITGGHVAIYVGGGQVISGGMNGVNATMQHPLSDLPGAFFVRVAG